MTAAKQLSREELRHAAIKGVADRLGDKRAQIKRLQDEAEALEDDIIQYGLEFGVKAVDGWRYRVAVSRSSRKTTSWQKIARDLGASARKIAANTKQSPVTRVIVTALKKSAG